MCTTTPDANGYGELINIGTTASPVWICKFDGASCPSPVGSQPTWNQYQNWSTTAVTHFQGQHVVYCNDRGCDWGVCSLTCDTSSHTWANTAPETCIYMSDGPSNVGVSACGPNVTGTATKTQIGCY